MKDKKNGAVTVRHHPPYLAFSIHGSYSSSNAKYSFVESIVPASTASS